MAKASSRRNAGEASPPVAAARRARITRDEVTDIEGLMAELGIRDRRTAVKLLKSLGLPANPIAGVILVNGEDFFRATKSEGEDS